MPPRTKPETQASKRCVDSIRRLGFEPIRLQSGTVSVKGGYMHCAPEGWPDWFIPLPGGKVVFWESKFRGEVSGQQLDVHQKLQSMGHIVYVGSDPGELARVIMMLRKVRAPSV